MDIEKTVKFFIFAILALLPITLGLVFFDYSPLYKIRIIEDFGITKSLIGISIAYTGVAVIIRMLMYYILSAIKDKNIKELISESSFLDIFYLSCTEVLIYSSIPIIITFVSEENFIGFIVNSLIVWAIVLVYWIIWIFIIRKKQFT